MPVGVKPDAKGERSWRWLKRHGKYGADSDIAWAIESYRSGKGSFACERSVERRPGFRSFGD